MAADCLEDGSDYVDEDIIMNPEFKKMAHKAIDDAIEMLEGEGLTQRAAVALVKKVMDMATFAPMLTAEGMMIGWSGEHDAIIVFGLNFEGDKFELSERFHGIDGKSKLLSVLCNQFNLDEAEVKFATLKYNQLDDDTLELYVKGL